jgi:hypothetical protein
MPRRFALVTPLALAACVSGAGEPPPLPPLAEDREQPVLALYELVLTAHFAAFGANPPTTCAALRPGPLGAGQEQALIVRFVRLAPSGRCRAQGAGQVDAITGGPAGVVEVYDFACRDAAHCTGWVTAPGRPATRYAMRYEGGLWHLSADPRLIAG